MINFLRRLFYGKDRVDHPAVPSMPWDARPSILDFIRSNIVTGRPGLCDEGYELPDEERSSHGKKIRWAPGALDGVATHHMASSEKEAEICQMVRLVLAYSQQPTALAKAAIYQYVISEQIVAIIDPVIEALIEEKNINHERLYELAHSFATESPDREPVKFGIAILGLFRRQSNEDLFQTLARHDEFTLFCAVAAENLPERREEALWQMARNVEGWGRIHVVEHLASFVTNPEIKRWLLREGYRNSVMNEYLAATCARAGNLLAALSEDQVDRDLLTGAGEIITALIAGGPAESLDEYEEGRPVLVAYLSHMDSAAETLNDFLCINAIKGYLDEDALRWQKRFDAGWDAKIREHIRSQCDDILTRPGWQRLVRSSLNSEDDTEFYSANAAASALGIDTWDIHWQRLQEKPLESGRWYEVASRCNEDRINMIIELAENRIDFARISTGAADELGLGSEFEPHRCLDYLLQELRRFPGRGEVIIRSALKSPVTRNRNLAIAAFESWSVTQRGNELRNALANAFACEPNESVRERLRKVLEDQPC